MASLAVLGAIPIPSPVSNSYIGVSWHCFHINSTYTFPYYQPVEVPLFFPIFRPVIPPIVSLSLRSSTSLITTFMRAMYSPSFNYVCSLLSIPACRRIFTFLRGNQYIFYFSALPFFPSIGRRERNVGMEMCSCTGDERLVFVVVHLTPFLLTAVHQ